MPSLLPRLAILLAPLLLAPVTALRAQQPPPLPEPPLPAWSPAPGGETAPARGRANVVHRHGLTWSFDRYYPVGEFANGDPWVVGPVRIVAIEPKSGLHGERTVHGSMIDPEPGDLLHGYDSALYGDFHDNRYRPERNKALGIAAEQPLLLQPGQSLVSVQSQLEPGPVSQLRTAAVLTCLAAEPPPDSFRPPYCRGDKTVRFRGSQLDFSVLGRLPPLAGAPDPGATAALFERVWLDHVSGWCNRFLHPVENMKDYGRDLCADVSSGALLLQCDFTDAQKRPLLVRMVQYGIDTYGNVKGGCIYPGEGGHGSGRKFCILLAGAVLHDAAMLRVGRDFPSGRRDDGTFTAVFSEDAQTFFVRETAPGVWNWGHGGYTREHDGLPEFGFSHANEPKNDQAAWEADPYRRCCTANAWVGQVLAIRIMGLQEQWAHPPLFAYMDRYLQTEPKGEWTRAWIPWQAVMWDAYRAQF